MIVFGMSPVWANVQPALVAGSFYASDPIQLRQMVQSYLDAVPTPTVSKQKILGGIVPHAGHVFSGPVAAHVFKTIQALKPKTILILGLSHYQMIDAACVLTADAYATPLGEVPIDTVLAKRIYDSSPLYQKTLPVTPAEHSIEVQLPFLQVALQGHPFKIVPVYIAASQIQQQEDLVATLLPLVRSENVFVLASSDWSHYHSDAEAKQLDTAGIYDVRSMLIGNFAAAYASHKTELCGFGPVYVMMKLAEQLGYSDVQLLDQRNSYDTTGRAPERVVGYAALLFKQARPLDKNQQTHLLELARDTIVNKIRYGSYTLKTQPSDPVLMRPQGVFVTITVDGKLHGCIGYIESRNPLYQNIQECALKAALSDPRFEPLTEADLDRMHLEVSVLSPVQPLTSVKDIVIGKTGLILDRGPRRGLLLPQVAVEQKWNVNQLLEGLCHKSELPPGAWKDPGTKLSYFTAEVFGE